MNNFLRVFLTILLSSGLLSLSNADAAASDGDRRKAVRPIRSYNLGNTRSSFFDIQHIATNVVRLLFELRR